MKFGVFTVSTPEYDILDCFDKLSAVGYDGLELRITQDDGDRSQPTFWNGNRTTLTAQQVIDRADELKAKAAQTGMEIPALGTYITAADLETVELHMRACAAVGANHLRVGSGPYHRDGTPYPEQVNQVRNQYRRVADLAAKYGVRALIETHMNQLAPSVTKAMNILRDLDPAHVGIMWDPGNQVREGSEVYAMALEEAGPYLGEVHAKNTRWVVSEEENGAVTWATENAPLREGGVNWPQVLSLLQERGYDGWIHFEDFSTVVPTDERVRANLSWFRSLTA